VPFQTPHTDTPPSANGAGASSKSEDEDFLLALKLQEQLDLELGIEESKAANGSSTDADNHHQASSSSSPVQAKVEPVVASSPNLDTKAKDKNIDDEPEFDYEDDTNVEEEAKVEMGLYHRHYGEQAGLHPFEDDEDFNRKAGIGVNAAAADVSTSSSGSAEALEADEAVARALEQTDMDADYALALALQSEFNEQFRTSSARRSSTSVDVNEKVSYWRSKSGEGGEAEDYSYLDDDDEDEADEDEDDEAHDAEYDEKFHNPHAPARYTGEPSKPHHQVVKAEGRQLKKVLVTKHDLHIASLQSAQKLEHYMDSGDMRSLPVAPAAYNALRKDTSRHETQRNRKRGNQKDRSASDSVIDAPTRINLFKMLNAGVLEEINGVISTGKESHVYHAIGGHTEAVETVKAGEEYAVKIFNMDMHQRFKDRTKYVDGEFRYRHVPTQNSRKAIKVWAEKELRNLKRLYAGGISCPRPVLLRNNVLIMQFIGKNGIPAPRLKDAKLSDKKVHEMYLQCVLSMRRMYQECRLVHADLSEYNILYYRGRLWFIDVSQTLECDHENALEFLRRDCDVITKFFSRRGVANAMNTQELFQFITDKTINSDNIQAYLTAMQERAEARGPERTNEEQIQAEVFKASFIPNRLSDVRNPTKEIEGVLEGRPDAQILHASVTGLRSDLSGPALVPEPLLNHNHNANNNNSSSNNNNDNNSISSSSNNLATEDNNSTTISWNNLTNNTTKTTTS
jgi:RIO kinase 1